MPRAPPPPHPAHPEPHQPHTPHTSPHPRRARPHPPPGALLTIGGSSARNPPTSPATNRLTAATYDASGNMTTWSGSLYAYDPFHLMWDYRTASDEWIYLYTADDERAWSYKTDNTSLW